MFDLEQAIAEWRQQMLAAGIKTPVPLEELESHLREDVAQRKKTGLDEQEAFSSAVLNLGQPKALRSEFKKGEGNIMKRKLVFGTGIIVLLLGTMMILPALGKHKQRNQAALAAGAHFFSIGWAGDEVYGLVWGTALSIGGIGTALYGIKQVRA